jgi:hypothetical protein
MPPGNRTPNRFPVVHFGSIASQRTKEGPMHGKHSMPGRVGIALALLLLAGSSARADLIWGYNWEPSAPKIAADGGGTGFLTLTDQPSKSASGTSDIIVTNIRAFSTAPTATPDKFTHANVSFTMLLNDQASNQTGSLTFSGFFSGTLTGNNANVKLTFTSPTTQALTLGGNTYSVKLGTFSPPGPPGDANAGGLNARVTVTPGVNNAPEPSTLMLAGLALPCLGLARWRKRRSLLGA